MRGSGANQSAASRSKQMKGCEYKQGQNELANRRLDVSHVPIAQNRLLKFGVQTGGQLARFRRSISGLNGAKSTVRVNLTAECSYQRICSVLWVQVWVQLKKEKWLPISRKRHQIGHLDFRSFRLLTEGLLVRI
jgi:hypothetical protein